MVDRIFLDKQEFRAAAGASVQFEALRGTVRAIRAGRESHHQPLTELVLPDGRLHLVFDLGDRPGATLHGPTVEAIELRLTGQIDQVTVEIAPGAVASLLGTSAWSVRSETCDLGDVIGTVAAEWLDRLLHSTPSDRRQVARDVLAARLRTAPESDHRAARAAAVLALEGRPDGVAPTVPQVAHAVGLGVRQLEQVFRDTVGLSPKEVGRLARFHRLCRVLTWRSGQDFAAAAYEAGYADQAHAAREVKRISGCTLTDLRDRGFFQDSPGRPTA